MPFSIAGNISNFELLSLRKFEKHFGVILSDKQTPLHQSFMIKQVLSRDGLLLHTLENLSRTELLSFIFILTQFGDVSLSEIPSQYTALNQIPFVIEWKKNHYMVPLEVLEFFTTEKLFKEQNYLFSLIPSLSHREKKAWGRWMGLVMNQRDEKSMNFDLYFRCRQLQKPFQGKTLIRETHFDLEAVWKKGTSEIMDWYYKGLTPFYYALEEQSKIESDPFRSHILQTIKAGIFVPKRMPLQSANEIKQTLVASVEGGTPQFRETLHHWEIASESNEPSLFPWKPSSFDEKIIETIKK